MKYYSVTIKNEVLAHPTKSMNQKKYYVKQKKTVTEDHTVYDLTFMKYPE